MTQADRASYELAELVATSRALASERDIKKLLAVILEKCRQVTGADAGSVYVIEEEDGSIGEHKPPPKKHLHFMLSQNDSIKIDFKDFHIDIDDKSIVGQAVLGKQPINIPDLTKLETTTATRTLRHNRSFDDKTGYRARSMLTVPMLSAVDEVIGVVQLINKKQDPGKPLGTDGVVVAFDHRAEELALAWVAMAGIALENALLYEEIRMMFDGFVDASVTAIESARSDDLGSLAAGRDHVGRSGQEGRRDHRWPVRRRAASRRPGSSRSSTRACCTTSARSACARRCWSRPRSSTRRSCAR